MAALLDGPADPAQDIRQPDEVRRAKDYGVEAITASTMMGARPMTGCPPLANAGYTATREGLERHCTPPSQSTPPDKSIGGPGAVLEREPRKQRSALHVSAPD